MSAAAGLIALWLLGLAIAVARRSWIWFAVAAVVGFAAALVQAGATMIVRGVHEDAVPGGAILAALGWAALGNAVGALAVWLRRR